MEEGENTEQGGSQGSAHSKAFGVSQHWPCWGGGTLRAEETWSLRQFWGDGPQGGDSGGHTQVL